jgi:hypothetical protein
MPTVPNRRPKITIAIVFIKEPVPRTASKKKATKSRENISGGPNFMARFAKTGARNMMPTTARVPPTHDPQAAIKRAAPARPLRVIW